MLPDAATRPSMEAEASDRYRPEARVVRLPAWRTPSGEKPAVYYDATDEWRPVHPIFIASLETLREGGTYEDMIQRALPVAGDIQENHVRILMRRWLWDLRLAGYLEIPLDEPPATFAGRYRRVKELGRGGVGIVHLCEDSQTGRQVVVKHAWGYLRAISKTEPAMREENEVLKALDHPGIPRHLDEFESEGLLHVVREYVEGEPVEQRVVREGRPSNDERARIMRSAADIVLHIHSRGYLFLDPTPGNFLLRPDGRLAVVDVGICRRHANGRALMHGQAGTRGYAAPEVVGRHDIGTWSDVFALACLHYFLASGHPPGHRWTRDERVEGVAKLDLGDEERGLMLASWHDAPEARPTMTAVLERWTDLAGGSSIDRR